jgi:hypothetical protein
VVADANKRFGRRYQVLTSGVDYWNFADLESFPSVKLAKVVVALKRLTTGVKSEIYYLTSSKSVGLGTNGQPIHRCSVTLRPASLAEYEAAGR